jgi:hypothetical protein
MQGSLLVRRSFTWGFPVVVAAACAALTACGSFTETSVTAPSGGSSRCQPSFDGSPRSFGAEGGTSSVAVTVARECSWAASSGASWVVITSGGQGQGDGTVAFRVDRNPDPVTRSGAIVVGDSRMDVAQQPAACGFEVARPTDAVTSQGGTLQLQIRTHPACDWRAASESSWLSVVPISGRGTALVSITVTVNTGGARSGAVVVAGERFQLTQPGPGPVPPSPPPAPTPGPPAPTPTPPPAPPPPPPPPPAPTDVLLSGKISELSGRCPNLSFEIKGSQVFTNRDTNFKRGKCGDMKKGREVTVIGRRLTDGTVEAREVELNRDDSDASLLFLSK